jgi:hypothetical protein
VSETCDTVISRQSDADNRQSIRKRGGRSAAREGKWFDRPLGSARDREPTERLTPSSVLRALSLSKGTLSEVEGQSMAPLCYWGLRCKARAHTSTTGQVIEHPFIRVGQ